MNQLGQIIAAEIGRQSRRRITLGYYMGMALNHPDHGYYTTREPFGSQGDFVTAPEISQMFGELVGLWLADLWQRAGAPPSVRLVELGPGRGTLMADVLRVAATVPGLTQALDVHFVETSARLRAAQAILVPHAQWHDDLQQVPRDRPVIILANEFFDALPFNQAIKTEIGWQDLSVAVDGDRFVRVPGQRVYPGSQLLDAAPMGSIVELRNYDEGIAGSMHYLLDQLGGAALIIDYGHSHPALGDTLQAIRDGAFTDPFEAPGEADLTGHVDFSVFARDNHAGVHGPVPQGVWLGRLGIEARAAALKARATPAQAAGIEAALIRLTAPAAMGSLFKVMALSAPGWPVPAGFDA